jgi:nuclear receptor interaction protein
MQDTIYDRLLKRELGNRRRYSAIKGFYSDRQWIKNLDIVNELDGHNGCVNALSWSKSGTLLASGSDDTHINIHTYQSTSDASPFKLATTISTAHSANIFSVCFSPNSNNRTVISAAGDSEVRVFDIETAGTSGSSSARGQGFASRGIQYLSEADTKCRVYRSHSDRVKRICTESSPYLFLTCSEDGEVRQFDLRQPSSAYPRPAGGGRWRQRDEPTGAVPPALISYRGRIDLNTISCSASQPHYIALGGSHMHCFLHDRRMLGRDMLAERGGTPSSSGYSDHDELMDQATQCVKRFAPNGVESKKAATGHITACKISDANPNEMVRYGFLDHRPQLIPYRSRAGQETGSTVLTSIDHRMHAKSARQNLPVCRKATSFDKHKTRSARGS